MPTVGQNIARFRKELGLSQPFLAKAVGVRQNTIAQIELGNTKKSKFLPEIARVLGKRISEIDESYSGPEEVALATLAEIDSGERNLPVYGSVERDGGGSIRTGEPVDYVRRPASLSKVKDGYGVIISDDSMYPEFRSGDIALINPHLPPETGDTCLFHTKSAGQLVFVIRSLIKRTKSHWLVEQWNPRQRANLSRREWECHLTVGRHNRKR